MTTSLGTPSGETTARSTVDRRGSAGLNHVFAVRRLGIDHAFQVRVRDAAGEARAYCRNLAFGVGSQASLRDRDEQPSAVELLLGALGGDLVTGLRAEAARRRIEVNALELTLSGRLDNVLVHLGVIGETGSPALAEVTGTLYASLECDAPVLDDLWRATLARSPLWHTLARAAKLDVRIRSFP